MSLLLPALSLYVHIPWCIKKCPYCDFNSHAVKSGPPENAYIDALLSDLAQDLHRFKIDRSINSIFIGGGTPSLFSPEAIARLLSGIRQQTTLTDASEITLEANPGTFESVKFAEFKALGINRLSIGIQSFQNNLLTLLGRVHNGNEALKAAEIARQAGFDNFNLDLMFGLPGAKPGDSESDVQSAIRLEPTHISLYQLTLEPNTWFHKFPPKLPDDESIFNTQLNCQKLLADAGYRQYEISAYSQPDRECRHNVNYWRFGDYLGIGAGAHGKISLELPGQIVRTAKVKKPEQYLENPLKDGISREISLTELTLEFMMNQLRLKSGFTLDNFQAATGLHPDRLENSLARCVNRQLLQKQDRRYTCTDLGWNFLDDVLGHFVTAE